MAVLVTGSGGFLGQAIVQELLQSGHKVAALVRASTRIGQLPWASHPAVRLIHSDLLELDLRSDPVGDINAVVHAAAAKSGSFAEQHRNTVETTRHLLQTMSAAGVYRLVAISSMSVYDTTALAPYAVLDEATPLEANPAARDAYGQTKLLQESLIREFGRHPRSQVTILRPGIVYGRDNLWNAHLGVNLPARFYLRIGRDAPLPLIYVANCAEAVRRALEQEEAIGATINLVDDAQPTRGEFIARISALQDPAPVILPFSWSALLQAARIATFANNVLAGGRLRLPGVLVPERVCARYKPLRYSNARAKQVLNWSPRFTLDAALKDCR
ncbi:MAG: NAD(P)-dependent oxidoreductase [Hyphomicrobiaceae bacterium]|nr:NAD(P)-dependent oxidoreductase [Hyphomicrobiaceae bacterium]